MSTNNICKIPLYFWRRDIVYYRQIQKITADITFKVKSALPEYEKDEKKQFAISGLLQGYFMQLMDLTEEYYDFLTVEEVEDK